LLHLPDVCGALMGVGLMNKALFVLAFMLISLSADRLFADGKKKKSAPIDRKAWNPYACCHKMDEVEHKQVLLIENYRAPDFFYFDTLYAGDTTFVYECYDSRDSVLCKDTLHDFEQVRYISLFKRYTDPAHTYNDNSGEKKPLPVSLIVDRYDKTGKDKWINISYPGNRLRMLKEYKNDVIRVDSFIEENRATQTTILSLYSYYKVAPLK
jgi:hypothetical protein